MAIYPPKDRNWWDKPIHKTELVWVTLAFIWGLIMFFAMIYWHIYGQQNLSNEAYRINADDFGIKVDGMVDLYTIREEEGYPVVKPPAGGDVYLLARLWEWYPILELEEGQSYRLHLSSMDWQHGFSLQPENINIQVHPGYEMVLTIRPSRDGTYFIICNEYCGFGHHQMVGRIYVTDSGGRD